MVRKRTRRYQSDDDDDSDSDFVGADTVAPPATKKYSLRERKSKPSNFESYVYSYADEDDDEQHPDTSDEDFNAEEEDEEETTMITTPYVHFDEDSEPVPPSTDGLIDFEDIIRADVVINRNKIDYDNLIQKTEIKVEQKKRRGRKPKNPINQVKIVETNEENTNCVTVICTTSNQSDEHTVAGTTTIAAPTEDSANVPEQVNHVESSFSESCGENAETELETNRLDDKSADNSDNKIELNNDQIEDKATNDLDDEDDDDIIIIEKKQEIIVLDD